MQQISSKHIAGIICRTLNHVDERLVDHGGRVAFIVLKMLKKDGRYDSKMIRDIVFIAMLHDIGAYKTEEISNMVQFETGDVWNHSIYGYLFLKYLSPFEDLASVVLFHHLDCSKLKDIDVPYKFQAQCVNIADRTDVYLAVSGREDVFEYLEEFEEQKFTKEVIDLMKSLEEEEHIFDRLEKNDYIQEVMEVLGEAVFTLEEIIMYLKMIIFTIDFRSPYTVMHTITTTRTSIELADIMGMDSEQIELIRFGALLHDLGKIGIPVEILEYPGKLSPQAMKIMRTHVNITEEIINGEIQEEIRRIAIRHHEKMDGSGYPRGLGEASLTQSERIVAIADIVSALCGRRSYKEAYEKDKIIEILTEMKNDGLLCPVCVDIMIDKFDEIMKRVTEYCEPVLEIYNHINEEYISLCEQWKAL